MGRDPKRERSGRGRTGGGGEDDASNAATPRQEGETITEKVVNISSTKLPRISNLPVSSSTLTSPVNVNYHY